MNNFPAMTEAQRELEIASVKEMRSHVDFWGHASGFDAEFLMRCADAYLAMLTAEPVGEVVSMKATVLDGMVDVRTTKVIRNASSIKRLPSGTKLYPAPPAPVLRVPIGWIKCSERMPELDTKVLLLFTQYDSHIEDGFIGDEGDDVGWYHYLYDGDALQSNPTHWMPLPSPPEERNEQ